MHIKMYGADWCLDCIHAKEFLNSRGIKIEYILITDNANVIAFLKRVNPGINGLMKIIT